MAKKAAKRTAKKPTAARRKAAGGAKTGPASTFDDVKRLVQLMAANDLTELNIEEGRRKILLKRGGVAAAPAWPVPVSAPPRLVLLVALGLELELALPLAPAGCVHLMPVVSGAPGPRRAHTKGSRRRSLGGASANRPGRRARWNWLKAFRRSICQQAKSGRRSSSALMPNTSFSTDAVMPTATWSGPR